MTMLRTRIIPTLLLRNESLVKTKKFSNFTYVGDPVNTVRIFNELEVDELLFLDITATRENRSPNLKVLVDIADECFMPLGYGGGINSLDQAKSVFGIGFEKIAINTQALENPDLISEIASKFGSQAVIASIDVKKDLLADSLYIPIAGGIILVEILLFWLRSLKKAGLVKSCLPRLIVKVLGTVLISNFCVVSPRPSLFPSLPMVVRAVFKI